MKSGMVFDLEIGPYSCTREIIPESVGEII